MDQKRILIVDDSEDTREMFKSTLEEEGFVVTEAADGMQGLELLRSQNFSLILLDLVMPKVNGEQMLQEMQRLGLAIDTPLMLVTADPNVGSLKVPSNVVGYLKKPFFYPELVHKIKKFFGMINENITPEANTPPD